MPRTHVSMGDAGITPRSVTRRDALRLFMGAGICATFCEGTGSEYYYAYYTKDGDRVDPDKIERKAERRQHASAPAPSGMPARRSAAGQGMPPMRGRMRSTSARPRSRRSRSGSATA